MSLSLIGAEGADDLHPVDGWGGVPEAERPLWSRYMVDHLPWFPGVTMMNLIAPGVMHGGTRAPQLWKQTARDLHAVGFTPADYYLLAELITARLDRLDPHRHAELFELWPARSRGPLAFRLTPSKWKPWVGQVRAGESPRRALEAVLSDGRPRPLGGMTDARTGRATIVD